MIALRKVLHKQILLLKSYGIETAELDAMLILSFGLGFPDNQYSLNQDRLISSCELKKISKLIQRRTKYEPVAKIIGNKPFWNSSFYVDEDVLDPRPETEVLVQSVLSKVNNARNILDLGTGSGCIAISLALLLKQVSVVGCDISEKALAVARKNAVANDVEVDFILSDWFESLSDKFDIIVSNPPYISTVDFSKLPFDVKTYDPKLALLGGVDGLECYREIFKLLPDHMTNEGLAFFEIGFGQRKGILKILCKSGLSLVNIWKDLNGIDRVICVKKDA